MKYFILFIFIANYNMAQNLKLIETDLLNTLKLLEKYNNDGNKDSLSICNELFNEKLLKYAKSNKEMLNYNFPNIDPYYLTTTASPDKKLKIYSWDTREGGSMLFYRNIIQWIDYDTLYAKNIVTEEGTPGGYYSKIFQLTDELNTFYFCYFNSVLSSNNHYQAIHCMDFERNVFNSEFKKIKTKSGTTYKLGFSFDANSLSIQDIGYTNLIKFNKTNQSLSIPVVNMEGKVSSKTIIYKYDGDYFVKKVIIRNEKG